MCCFGLGVLVVGGWFVGFLGSLWLLLRGVRLCWWCCCLVVVKLVGSLRVVFVLVVVGWCGVYCLLFCLIGFLWFGLVGCGCVLFGFGSGVGVLVCWVCLGCVFVLLCFLFVVVLR